MKKQRIRVGTWNGMREQYGGIIYNYYKACINHDNCKCLVVILNIKMKIIILNGVLLAESSFFRCEIKNDLKANCINI